MTDKKLEDVQTFFEAHKFQGLEKHVTMTGDCIRRNVAWVQRDLIRTQHYLETLVSKIL